MKKIWLIIKREYLTRVMKKSFLLTTLLAPLGMALLIILPIGIRYFGNDQKSISVMDESKLFTNKFNSSKDVIYSYTKAEQLQQAKQVYQDSGYTALLYIPIITKLDSIQGITLYTQKPMGISTLESIEKNINDIIFTKRIETAGLQRADYNKLKKEVQVTNIITNKDIESKGSSIAASIAGYLTGFLIYIVLIIYGTSVMRSVMEEKTNRIVELIISSVKPMELMLGKIIGVGAVGLTQFALWIILGAVVNISLAPFIMGMGSPIEGELAQNAMNTGSALSPDFNIQEMINSLPIGNLIFSILFYFLGGYLIYASLFAAVGSAASEEMAENQSLVFPVTLPIIISLIIMINSLNNPDGSLAFWASIFPLTSPIVMPSRIPFGVPLWQQAISMVLLILSFLGATWVAGKIYKTGILMYGKKITFVEMIKWLKH
jgi:ABC-2 type transport system permease protein